MSELTQERLKKPLSDDMSMDEILASIRKIISSDSNIYDSNSDNEVSRPRTTESIKNPHNLSAREQLLSLTTRSNQTELQTEIDELYQYKSNPISQKKPSTVPTPDHIVAPQKQMPEQRAENPLQHKTTYEKLSSQDHTSTHSLNKHNTAEENTTDADILRTLNQIRQSLSIDSRTPEKITDNSYYSQTIDKQPTNYSEKRETLAQNSLSTQGNMPVKMTSKEVYPVIKNPEIIHDVDLRPSQFSSDSVPDFLKKFKKQQLEDRTATNSVQTPQYDLSSLPKFDEEDDILSLTDKIMPNSVVNKEKKQESLSNTVSKLRAGTEEIMRRATERCLLGDDVDDIAPSSQEENSPFASLIMKTMKPMIKEWIDENMEEIAKQVLHQELRRGLK